MSDSKQLDTQAGLKSGISAVLAALSGINNISGPGMLDFESCLSLEKLVVDNEICGMAFRLIAGIEPREDFPALGIFQELVQERYLLISEHTRRYLDKEHFFPGPVIDRARRSRWEQDGALRSGSEHIVKWKNYWKVMNPARQRRDGMNHQTCRSTLKRSW